MNLLNMLHQDHINMSVFLTLLEKNVLQIRAGEIPDLNLMSEAIEFISHFADIYHHPLEDRMFEYFFERSKELQVLVQRCEREHKELKEHTEKILQPIKQTLLDGMIPMEQVLSAIDGFLQAEKRHINFEESQLFPLIKEIASESDWEELGKNEWLQKNAKLDKSMLNEYAEIYAELQESIPVD